MAQYTAVLEQASDGGWGAYTLNPTVIAGAGDTREEALEDLKSCIVFWLEYMKDTGQEVPSPTTEIINIEVAA